MHPAVSVILPIFNCEQYLDLAIKSVLEQATPLELILVDDGSTDGSSRIAHDYSNQCEQASHDQASNDRMELFRGKSIRYIRQANKGVAAARNTGIDAANCDLLAFIDADDIWTPGKLKRHVDVLSDRPEVACVIGKIQPFFDKDQKVFESSNLEETLKNTPSRVLFGEPYYCYVLGSTVIRRSSLNRIGKMDESMKISSDMEWFLRLRDKFGVEKIDFVSLLYRSRPGSLTAGKEFMDRNLLPLLKQSLDRRRASGGESINHS